MSKKFYVYSTLSSDTRYTNWKQGGGDMKIRDGAVLINGGSNVVDNKHLITPQGVLTIVSEADMVILQKNPQFNRHKERGFISVQEQEVKIEKVVSDMVQRDDAAPLVPEDYNAEEAAQGTAQAAPIVNTEAANPKPVIRKKNPTLIPKVK